MKEKEIEKLQELTYKSTKDTIQDLINEPIYNLNEKFWDEIKEPYCAEIESVLENCNKILKKGFIEKQLEKEEFMDRIELELKKTAQDYVKRLFRDINTNLLRKFNKLFKNNNGGQPNDWVKLEEQYIRDYWLEIKQQCLAITASFKYIEIPIDLSSSVLNQTPGEAFDIDPFDGLDD